MTKRELRELIRTVIKEYTGTGSSGGNTENPNKSPRPYIDAEDEIEAYTDKGAPFGGAEGRHTRGMEPVRGAGNMNRTKMTRY